MARDVDGHWPWESGGMPERKEPEPAAERKAPLYTLPTVKDRRAEGGRRPASAKDLARLKRERERGGDRYFRW